MQEGRRVMTDLPIGARYLSAGFRKRPGYAVSVGAAVGDEHTLSQLAGRLPPLGAQVHGFCHAICISHT